MKEVEKPETCGVRKKEAKGNQTLGNVWDGGPAVSARRNKEGSRRLSF